MLKIPILLQLYLLQLENYNLRRYWQVVFRHGEPKRKIVWTAKTAAVLILAILLTLWFAQSADNVLASIVILVAVGWINFLAAVFLSAAVLILWPLDFMVKRLVVSQAKRRLGGFPKLKIIGITGSFGKTTMKEALAEVLGTKYKVLKTPENINTPLGIARLIKEQLNDSVEILIVEMGAYHRGDIKRLCDLTQPDIAILTGINEAHLERFGSMSKTIATKFEIVQYAKPDALIVLNKENDLVKQNFQKYVHARAPLWYQRGALENKSALLGDYAAGTVNACGLIGKHLGMADEEIAEGIKQIKTVPHRLQLISTTNGVTVIDDSYNGNPDGVREAIKVLARYKDKRKIYLTPGLVEMGGRTETAHRDIGRQLSSVADVVILIKNSVTPFIAEGLTEQGFSPANIWWFNSAKEVHGKLGDLLQPGDVILFQNDWPENYT